MPPPKRGQASFAKKKVEIDPEEARKEQERLDAVMKKKRLEAAKRFSVGGTVDLATLARLLRLRSSATSVSSPSIATISPSCSASGLIATIRCTNAASIFCSVAYEGSNACASVQIS